MKKLTDKRPIGVGIVGAGMVAQVVHLRVLGGLPRQFRPAAIYDIDRNRAEAVSRAFGIPKACETLFDLAQDSSVDAVLVCNSDEYHADAACAVLQAGKAVLLEKPAALALTEIDRMIELQEKCGGSVLIGYMRSFADAVRDLQKGLPRLGQVRLVLCRDIIGPNEYFLRQLPDIIPASSLNKVAQHESRARIAKALDEYGIDRANKALGRGWQNLCAVGVHDLSTLRSLFGSAREVLSASLLGDGDGVSAQFILDDSTPISYQLLIDRQGRFDARIEIFGESGAVSLAYNTPFLRNLPTTLEWLTTENDKFEQRTQRPSFVDPFTREWQHFHAVLTQGTTPETTLVGAREDMALIHQIVEKLSSTGQGTSVEQYEDNEASSSFRSRRSPATNHSQ
jgi:predicted dehydrogenase